MSEARLDYSSKVRIPNLDEKVFREECMFSLDTPQCETGLYICLMRFWSIGQEYIKWYHEITGNSVFLHIRKIKKKLKKSTDDPPSKKPTRLAIGIEGGFSGIEEDIEVEDIHTIYVLPDGIVIPLDDPNLPSKVRDSALSALSHESYIKSEEIASLAGTWDGDKRVISKHADNLLQLPNCKPVPPSGWKCEMCDLKDNLWLNLTDGLIFCGRKFWDGTGGNNHAVEHFSNTRYPLAVKLGTITGEGGDVYSYDEDDMVEDPHLAKHLAHFGINVLELTKTEKTMTELEIALNERIGEWDIIQETNSDLTPIHGNGYTGIHNLGNSCYLSSVMQLLFIVPDFIARYVSNSENIIKSSIQQDPSCDFNAQMAKLGKSLTSDRYSKEVKDIDSNEETQIVYQNGIYPYMFKYLVGKGHPEFSTKKQQDAQEFLLHMTNMIEKHSLRDVNPVDTFKFKIEDRVECASTNKVRYTERSDILLSLPIPLDAVTNQSEVDMFISKKKEMENNKMVIAPKDVIRPIIPLSACIDQFLKVETIDDFYSTALQAKTLAMKKTTLLSFPDYLLIHLKKFTIGNDWVPTKLDVVVDIPDELDLSNTRGMGLQPGEALLPEESSSKNTSAKPEIDIEQVTQLANMGFNREGCRKAVYNTNNTGIEAAMNWIMEHMNDADFSSPITFDVVMADEFCPDVEAVAMLGAMGFTPDQATYALKETNNNLERAADWIFSHSHELDNLMQIDQFESCSASSSTQSQVSYRDGPGKYELVGFISHMGTSSMAGHYVCHIKKDGRWVIFNDEKVQLSENPPKGMGYIYLYKRK